jgi:hypothetical protein
MSSEQINIEPVPVDNQITSIKLFIDNFTLNASDCWISVYKYDKNEKLVDVVRVYIEPELYVDWGVSDKYIEDIVLSKLDYTRKVDVFVNM